MLANEDNFKEYMKQFGRKPLVTPSREPTTDELIAEGMSLLKKDTSVPKKSIPLPVPSDNVKLESTLGKVSSNPYVRARVAILKKMTSGERKEIEDMELNHKIDNRFYEDFCCRVASLGDSFSE